MNIDNLETDRLHFRQFVIEDLPDLERLLGDKDVCEFLPGETPFPPEIIGKWLQFFVTYFDKEKPNLIYAVHDKKTNQFIGYAGLAWVREFDKNEIMYALVKNAWGKGYATECSLRMKQLAIDYQLDSVIGLADIGNIGSQKVLEKTGFIYKETIELWGATLKFYTMNL